MMSTSVRSSRPFASPGSLSAAASAGFEWETVDDVWAKVDEEVAELKAAYACLLYTSLQRGHLLAGDAAVHEAVEGAVAAQTAGAVYATGGLARAQRVFQALEMCIRDSPSSAWYCRNATVFPCARQR